MKAIISLLFLGCFLFASEEKSLDNLIEELQSKDVLVRYEAAKAIGEMGPKAEKATLYLVKALADYDGYVYRRSIEALEKIDPNWKTSSEIKRAIPYLVQKTFDPDWRVQHHTSQALDLVNFHGKNSFQSEETVLLLIKILPECYDKSRAKEILSAKDTPGVTKALESRGSLEETIYKLDSQWAKRPEAKKILPRLFSLLSAKEMEKQFYAIKLINRISSKKAIPELIKKTLSSNWHINIAANEVLGRIDPSWEKTTEAKEAIPYLIEIKESGSWYSYSALDLLNKIDPHWEKSFLLGLTNEELMKKLASIEKHFLAKEALAQKEPSWERSPQAKIAIVYLIQALLHDNMDIEDSTIEILEKIDPSWTKSPQAKESVDYLCKELSSSEVKIRFRAAQTLEKIAPVAQRAIPYLIKSLMDEYFVANQAKETLNNIDKNWIKLLETRKLIPNFIMHLVRGESEYALAEEILNKIDPHWVGTLEAKRAVPSIVIFLSDPNSDIRFHAAKTLGKMGKTAIEAVPILKRSWERERSFIIASALSFISSQESPPYLFEALKNIDSCLETVDILSSFRPITPGTIHHLIKALSHQKEEVCSRILQTLTKLDPNWTKSSQAREAIAPLIVNLAILWEYSEESKKLFSSTLETIDPEWIESLEARQSITLLIKALPHYKNAKDYLEKIDKNWAKSSEAKEAIASLVDTLFPEDFLFYDIQAIQSAIQILATIDAQSDEVFPYIIVALSNSKSFEQTMNFFEKLTAGERKYAVDALGKLKPVNEIVPFLTKMLFDPDKSIRSSAQKVLQETYSHWTKLPYAQNAISHLVPALCYENVHEYAKEMLLQINKDWMLSPQTKLTIPSLVVNLVSSNEHTQTTANKLLEQIDKDWLISPLTQKAIPEIIKTLCSDGMSDAFGIFAMMLGAEEKEDPRIFIESVLEKINKDWIQSPEARKTIPYLVAALPNSMGTSYAYTEELLQRIDKNWTKSPEARTALPLLTKLLTSNTSYFGQVVKDVAEKLLLEIDSNWAQAPETQPAIPFLIKSLHSDQQESAIEALGKIGSPAKEAIPKLIEILPSSYYDTDTRKAIIKTLQNMKSATRSVIPELIQTIADSSNQEFNALVFNALEEIQPSWRSSARKIVPQLLKNSISLDKDTRSCALLSLKKIDGEVISLETKKALPYFIKALSSHHKEVRLAALKNIQKLEAISNTTKSEFFDVNSLIPDIVNALPYQDVYSSTKVILLSLDPHWPKSPLSKNATPGLVRNLENHDEDVQKNALEVLHTIDNNWKSSPQIEETLADFSQSIAISNYYIRYRAAKALGIIGKKAQSVTPDLIKALSSSEENLQAHIVESLDKIDSSWRQSDIAKETTIGWVKSLFDLDEKSKAYTAIALKNVDSKWQSLPIAQDIASTLTKKITDLDFPNYDENNVWQKTISTAQIINPKWFQSPSKETTEHLMQFLQDNWPKNEFAAKTLGKMNLPEEALPDLIKSLSHYNDNVKKNIAKALGKMGKREAIPHLIVIFLHYSEEVRLAGSEALNKIDLDWINSPEARKAIPQVMAILSSNGNNENQRLKALKTLQNLKPSREIITNLVQALSTENEDICTAITHFLEKLDKNWKESPEAQKAIPYFIEIISNYYFRSKSSILQSLDILAEIKAKEAIPSLIKVTTKLYYHYKDATGKTLDKIDKQWRESPEVKQTILDLKKSLDENSDNEERREEIMNILKILSPSEESQESETKFK